METSPFQPGDRVVRVGDTISFGGPAKDQIYTVEQTRWCCKDIGWRIDLSEISHPLWIQSMVSHGLLWTGCNKCEQHTHGWMAVDFRKLSDELHTVESLLEELKTTVKEPVTV